METIELRRDCMAIRVPGGERIILVAGAGVVVMQALGGSVTVQTESGELARIDRDDADALGFERTAVVPDDEAGAPRPLEERVWEELREIYDPEIPVNVVDLGLIHACRVARAELGGARIEIGLMLTAPGCGIGDVLKSDIERRLVRLRGVAEVEVEIVLDPPWDPSRMSDAARLATGI